MTDRTFSHVIAIFMVIAWAIITIGGTPDKTVKSAPPPAVVNPVGFDKVATQKLLDEVITKCKANSTRSEECKTALMKTCLQMPPNIYNHLVLILEDSTHDEYKSVQLFKERLASYRQVLK